MNIRNFTKAVHENAVEHGWWDKHPSFGETIALCHSELSEALEEYRNDMPMMYVMQETSTGARHMEPDMSKWTPEDKPEGVAVEMADCLIRILDWFGNHPELDVEAILALKHAFNKSRPYRHGNKRL